MRHNDRKGLCSTCGISNEIRVGYDLRSARGSSAKFPQTRAWVRGLKAHLEEQTEEEWTFARIADEADVEYGLLRRWATGLNEPKAGNQRKLSTFAHRFGYQTSHNNVDSGHTHVEPAPMLNTVEMAPHRALPQAAG
jgi:hypothetical protein